MYPTGEQVASNLASPLENLDAAQAILLQWGDIMIFCWSAWDDQRIARSEYIVHLVRDSLCCMKLILLIKIIQTITWLFHLDFDQSDGDEYNGVWKDRLSAAIMKSPHAFSYTLLVSSFLQLSASCFTCVLGSTVHSEVLGQDSNKCHRTNQKCNPQGMLGHSSVARRPASRRFTTSICATHMPSVVPAVRRGWIHSPRS